MPYLVSNAASLFAMSDKLVVGFALRLGLSALSELSPLISARMFLNSLEISLSSLLNEANCLPIDTCETNSTTMHESMNAIATKDTTKRNRSDVERFAGFRSLLDSCSILANTIQTVNR